MYMFRKNKSSLDCYAAMLILVSSSVDSAPATEGVLHQLEGLGFWSWHHAIRVKNNGCINLTKQGSLDRQKLVYKSNKHGLWYSQLQLMMFTTQLRTGGPHCMKMDGSPDKCCFVLCSQQKHGHVDHISVFVFCRVVETPHEV